MTRDMERPLEPNPGPGWRTAALFTLVLAAAVRVSTPAAHFAIPQDSSGYRPNLDDAVLVAADADAAMHTRRALAWIEQFPWPPLHDSFLGFPEGAIFPWAPGWDAALALFALLCGGFDAESLGFQVGLALFPLVIGVLTVFVVMRGTLQIFGVRAAITAGVCAALVPQHVAATQFARPDHSGAEGLFLTGLVLALASPAPRRRTIALWTAGATLVWVGGFVYVILATGAWVLAHLFTPPDTPAPDLTGIAIGALIALPIAGVCGVQADHLLDYARLSLFHPLSILLAVGAGSWLARLRHAGKPSPRLVLECLALSAGGLVLASAALHGFREWLTTGDPWLATVTEMQPLLAPSVFSAAPWERTWRLLGFGFFLLPFCLLHLARTSQRPHKKVVWIATTCCLLLALLQNRFGWTLAPMMSVVVGASLASLTPWAPGIGLLLAIRSPAELNAAFIAPKTRQNRAPWVFEAYRWIATGTEEVDEENPSWGVAGTWRHGHWVNVLGNRPSSIGHFGSYAGGVERYLFTEQMLDGSTEDLLNFMDENQLRYLVVAADELRDDSAPLHRLRFGGSGSTDMSSVGGLVPVYASSQPNLSIDPTVPGAWVFERIQGAILEGQGSPGSRVEFVLPVKWLGRWNAWRSETQIDPEGKWKMTVPIWTSATHLSTQEKAWIKVAEQSPIAVEITETAAREGQAMRIESEISP